jgi:CheY-like chemotaxis protein
VDDEEPIRQLMERMLRRCGYSVVHAGSGEEALSVCQCSGAVLRLVVTDITMPGMNGFDLAERIAERWPSVKILFITGLRNDCGIRRKLCDRPILEKPFTGDDLTKKVRALLTETASGN